MANLLLAKVKAEAKEAEEAESDDADARRLFMTWVSMKLGAFLQRWLHRSVLLLKVWPLTAIFTLMDLGDEVFCNKNMHST